MLQSSPKISFLLGDLADDTGVTGGDKNTEAEAGSEERNNDELDDDEARLRDGSWFG